MLESTLKPWLKPRPRAQRKGLLSSPRLSKRRQRLKKPRKIQVCHLLMTLMMRKRMRITTIPPRRLHNDLLCG
jgi:hypothetical protein